MPLKVTNLRLPVEEPEEALRAELAAALGIDPGDVEQYRILRKSLDARSRKRLEFVYSAVVQCPDEADQLARAGEGGAITRFEETAFIEPPPGAEPLAHRPVIVGSGPAGLLAGYYLALRGYRPLILERGQPVKPRVRAIRDFDAGGVFDRENNYLFGEGGAGTFSDGKLTCRMSGPDVDWVLEQMVQCGGKPSIRYEHRPHLGSNRLPMLVRNFRRKIEALGGEYRFGCRMEGLEIVDGVVRGLQTSSGHLPAEAVVLGIGHSARDTYRMLHELGVPMRAKAFQLGLRIEQPQEQVNRHKYGKASYCDILGAADYNLVARGQKDLFTFCMCAGGLIIPSVSEPEMFCTNGMSNSRHDTPYANSGLVVTLEPSEMGSDHPLAGVEVQRKYEAIAYRLGRRDYLCPVESAADFLAERRPQGPPPACSYKRGTVSADLSEVLPPVILKAVRSGLKVMDKKWRGDFLRNAVLVGPEMRGSSPVRIDRDRESYMAPGITGLYPAGEGAGYAGGIISAAVDGLRCAKAIVGRFAALEE